MSDSPYNQPPQTIPPQPPPMSPYQPVATPPPQKGSSALKIVLVIVAIFVGLGIIGAGIVGYGIYKVSKAVHVTSNSKEPITASDLGVAIYPGATQGKGSLRMTIGGKTMVTANYLTSDSKDQVIAFYKQQLGSDAQSTTTSNGATFVDSKGGGDTITVTVSQSPSMLNGKTQIVIAHVSAA